MSIRDLARLENVLPCPFCGSKDINVLKGEFYQLACSTCGAVGPEQEESHTGQESAIEGWNQRTCKELLGKGLGKRQHTALTRRTLLKCPRCGGYQVLVLTLSIDENFEYRMVCCSCGLTRETGKSESEFDFLKAGYLTPTHYEAFCFDCDRSRHRFRDEKHLHEGVERHLKTCPCCGGANVKLETDCEARPFHTYEGGIAWSPVIYSIHCDCGLEMTGWDSKEKIIKRWNRWPKL